MLSLFVIIVYLVIVSYMISTTIMESDLPEEEQYKENVKLTYNVMMITLLTGILLCCINGNQVIHEIKLCLVPDKSNKELNNIKNSLQQLAKELENVNNSSQNNYTLEDLLN